MTTLTETQRKWKAHIDAASAANQTLADYAREHGLKRSTLYAHSRKLSVQGRVTAKRSFVRVQAPAAPATVRIELPNGVRMHVSAPPDLQVLLTQLSRLP